MLRQAAVLGSPIGHSLSPVLHRAAYAALGLTGWSYEAVECIEADFPGWFARVGSVATQGSDPAPGEPIWAGLSLTMPLKQVVLPLLDDVSALARATGSVNTVTWDAGGRSAGENTDVHGIVEALKSTGTTSFASAALVGAGATASSTVAAMSRLGCTELTVLARSAAKARDLVELAESLSIRATPVALDAYDAVLAADVAVCTLPAPVSADWVLGLEGSAAGVLLDVTYHPWPPVAVQHWQKLGGTAVGGFEMLLQQAGEQVRLMTGLDAPLEAMRAAASPES